MVTLVWLGRHIDISRARRNASRLSSDMFDGPPTPAPSVSVVVAARDEEAVIERCVRTLLDQDYPDMEVIVVNDRSGDRTGEILDACRRQAPDKLRVVTVTQGRPGWFGKVNAVQTGVAIAQGQYLLFSDADCEQVSKHTVSVAVRFAIERDIDFLSVMPVMVASCTAEAIIQPVCVAVLMFWHPPEKVNDPGQSAAYANGAFMLIRREAYERIGGHERVRDALCEDMQLARNAKSAGVRLHVAQNRDLYRTRMYDTFGEAWRGWTRILQGSLQRPRRVLLAMVLLLLFSIGPWVALAASVAGLVPVGSGQPAEWGLAATVWGLAVLAQQSVMIRFYPMLGLSPRWAPSYLGGALLCFGIMLNALLKLCGLGSTKWRGTTYRSRDMRTDKGEVAGDRSADVTA